MCWDDIPLVKLGKVLRGMIWFNGCCYLLNRDKTEYEKYDSIPRHASLEMQYRKKEIIIICNWEERETPLYSDKEYPDRFAIGIEEPHHPNFQISRWRIPDQIIFRCTRFYSTAIDKIEDAIYEAQEVIDEEIAKEEREQKR